MPRFFSWRREAAATGPSTGHDPPERSVAMTSIVLESPSVGPALPVRSVHLCRAQPIIVCKRLYAGKQANDIINQGLTFGGRKMTTSKCLICLYAGQKRRAVKNGGWSMRREIVRSCSLSTSLRQSHPVKPHTPQADPTVLKKVNLKFSDTQFAFYYIPCETNTARSYPRGENVRLTHARHESAWAYRNHDIAG